MDKKLEKTYFGKTYKQWIKTKRNEYPSALIIHMNYYGEFPTETLMANIEKIYLAGFLAAQEKIVVKLNNLPHYFPSAIRFSGRCIIYLEDALAAIKSVKVEGK